MNSSSASSLHPGFHTHSGTWMHLTIANKLYSSWSLRPWILMRALDIPFSETVLPLYRPESKARLLAASPTGKVPVLDDGGVKVWESLAILEHLAERYPAKAVWPRDPKARAQARAVSAEMHAGFTALRRACPMNLAKRFAPRASWDAEVEADVARIEAIWHEARARFGTRNSDEGAAGDPTGPFLYGAFSAADAMYAPVVTRLDTYRFGVSATSRAYMDAVLGHPAFQEWRNAALKEPWELPHYEVGHTPEVDCRRGDV